MQPERQKPNWSRVKAALSDFDQKTLIRLIKDLFDASPDNRAFLAARFIREEYVDWALEEYRRRIVEQFYPKRGFGNPKMSVCRRAISDYRKARGDLDGLADLMLTIVEVGTQFARDFGVDDGAYFDSLGSMFESIIELLSTGQGMYVYGHLQHRVERLAQVADGMGYGHSDLIDGGIAILDFRYREWSEVEP
jgi:hypothetical protein